MQKRVKNPINPNHYRVLKPEPIDVIIAWNLPYIEGNILKYLARWKNKGGVEDLKKAQWYLQKLIDHIEE